MGVLLWVEGETGSKPMGGAKVNKYGFGKII
jgi:hypothetical protein